ncbi:MAG: hypothetical protein U0531_11270 [Dehalococcoidia bacterium]
MSSACRRRWRPTCRETLRDAGVELDDDLLIVSREIPRQGRSAARVNGRAVVQTTLAAIGRRLVDIHGQADNLSILRPENTSVASTDSARSRGGGPRWRRWRRSCATSATNCAA